MDFIKSAFIEHKPGIQETNEMSIISLCLQYFDGAGHIQKLLLAFDVPHSV